MGKCGLIYMLTENVIKIVIQEETDMDYRSSNTDAGADRTWNDILFVSIFM